MNMKSVRVDFLWLDPENHTGISLPTYHSELASGMDIQAAVAAATIIQQGEIKLISTGFAVALPPGYELQIRPRSGLAIKHGISIINSPGTIDADYRGEVKIGLINLGPKPYTVNRGDRIAQMILAPVVQAELHAVESLDETERQDGGFGHTGL